MFDIPIELSRDLDQTLAKTLQLQQLHQKKKPTYYGGL
jgi:hypothetical protein